MVVISGASRAPQIYRKPSPQAGKWSIRPAGGRPTVKAHVAQ